MLIPLIYLHFWIRYINGRVSQFNNESGWPIISKEAQRKILGIIADELDILQLRAYMRIVIYPSGQF